MLGSEASRIVPRGDRSGAASPESLSGFVDVVLGSIALVEGVSRRVAEMGDRDHQAEGHGAPQHQVRCTSFT